MFRFLLFACIATLSSVLALADVVIIPHVVTGMDPASQLEETENAEIAVKLRDKGGNVVPQRTITLEPLHKMTQLLTEDGLFPGITEFEGSLEVESSVPITVLVVRVDQTYWSSFPAFPG